MSEIKLPVRVEETQIYDGDMANFQPAKGTEISSRVPQEIPKGREPMSEREMDATKIIENINRGIADGQSKAKSWIDQENEAKDELLRDAAEQWEKSKDRQEAGRSFYRGFDEGWAGGVAYGRDPQNPTPNRPADSQPASDLVEKAREWLDNGGYALNEREYNLISQWMADFCSQQNADLSRKVRELEAMLSRTNDIRGFSWHIQRRRENGQIEWFSTSAESGSVFGPFTSALEAFTALEEKEQI